MSNSSNPISSSTDPLSRLKILLNNNPELVFSRIKQLFNFSKDSEENIKEYANLINKGHAPVIYSNHQSHTDGVIIAILIESIRKKVDPNKLKGFLCPVAASMASGDQHDRVQGGTFLFEPIFNKLGFMYVPIIREDDRKKYGMEGSNRDAIIKLLHAPSDNYGLIVFPEGTVKGGRIANDNKIYGMQEVAGGGILLRCISFWQAQKKKSAMLPVGILNSYKTFDPDDYDVPKSLLDMIAGVGDVERVVDIEVGKPFTDEEYVKELGSPLDPKSQNHIDLLMKKIAILLPDEAKGYYKS